jgi:hypothetical protein
MLFAAQVYHTQPHNLTAQSNNGGCASGDSARDMLVCLEVASFDPQLEINGRGFFCVLKETLNG